MKILIAEDNPVNATMMRVSLEKERYEVVAATDGEEALTALEAHPDVDLLITDVMMPGLGGLEMLDRIRRRPEWRTLPVVVATSLANQTTVRQAVTLHCKHFMVKPFTVPLLMQTVREAIGQRGAVLQDKGQAIGRLGIDATGYEQLAVTFSSFVHERVGTFQEICERSQHDEVDVALQRDLYALDESAGLLGAERLTRLLAAFGLPSGAIAADERAGVYKALLTELRLLATALPAPKKALRLEPSAPSAGEPSAGQ